VLSDVVEIEPRKVVQSVVHTIAPAGAVARTYRAAAA